MQVGHLEHEIKRIENIRRDRIEALEAEVRDREKLIREREERVKSLESQVRRLETPRLPPPTDNFDVRLKEVVSALPGWCTESKAIWMAHQIRQNGYQTAAEVGVFAGRSIFPIALAIAANQGRAVFAIDAW